MAPGGSASSRPAARPQAPSLSTAEKTKATKRWEKFAMQIDKPANAAATGKLKTIFDGWLKTKLRGPKKAKYEAFVNSKGGILKVKFKELFSYVINNVLKGEWDRAASRFPTTALRRAIFGDGLFNRLHLYARKKVTNRQAKKDVDKFFRNTLPTIAEGKETTSETITGLRRTALLRAYETRRAGVTAQAKARLAKFKRKFGLTRSISTVSLVASLERPANKAVAKQVKKHMVSWLQTNLSGAEYIALNATLRAAGGIDKVKIAVLIDLMQKAFAKKNPVEWKRITEVYSNPADRATFGVTYMLWQMQAKALREAGNDAAKKAKINKFFKESLAKLMQSAGFTTDTGTMATLNLAKDRVNYNSVMPQWQSIEKLPSVSSLRRGPLQRLLGKTGLKKYQDFNVLMKLFTVKGKEKINGQMADFFYIDYRGPKKKKINRKYEFGLGLHNIIPPTYTQGLLLRKDGKKVRVKRMVGNKGPGYYYKRGSSWAYACTFTGDKFFPGSFGSAGKFQPGQGQPATLSTTIKKKVKAEDKSYEGGSARGFRGMKNKGYVSRIRRSILSPEKITNLRQHMQAWLKSGEWRNNPMIKNKYLVPLLEKIKDKELMSMEPGERVLLASAYICAFQNGTKNIYARHCGNWCKRIYEIAGITKKRQKYQNTSYMRYPGSKRLRKWRIPPATPAESRACRFAGSCAASANRLKQQMRPGAHVWHCIGNKYIGGAHSVIFLRWVPGQEGKRAITASWYGNKSGKTRIRTRYLGPTSAGRGVTYFTNPIA